MKPIRYNAEVDINWSEEGWYLCRYLPGGTTKISAESFPGSADAIEALEYRAETIDWID